MAHFAYLKIDLSVCTLLQLLRPTKALLIGSIIIYLIISLLSVNLIVAQTGNEIKCIEVLEDYDSLLLTSNYFN